jgi:hypothetical protein
MKIDNLDDDEYIPLKRIFDKNTIENNSENNTNDNISILQKVENNSTDKINPINIFEKEKNLQFYTVVSVILVPSRSEYKEANLLSTLWYSSLDLQKFSNDAFRENKIKLLFSH